MAHEYTMASRMPAARLAAQRSEAFLRAQLDTLDVVNVEDDPEYRKIDVDLLCHKTNGSTIKVEANGDEQAHIFGNYAFEIWSAEEVQSPGCFLYSEADIWHYHVLKTGELHEFQLAPVRAWFLKNQHRFRLTPTKTPRRDGYGTYTTVCRYPPIRVVHAELPGVVRVHKVA